MGNKKKDAGYRSRTNATAPMIKMIAHIAADKVEETDFFGWGSGLKLIYCDLLLKLYQNGQFYDAVELIDFIFYLQDMYDVGQVVSIAAAGNVQENFRDFLDMYFREIDICGTFNAMKENVKNEN